MDWSTEGLEDGLFLNDRRAVTEDRRIGGGRKVCLEDWSSEKTGGKKIRK